LADKGLKAVSSLTGLTSLDLSYCPLVTDVGLQELTSLTALTTLTLWPGGSSTSKAGRDALKAAIPALAIY
jgi:hypothetical protein